MKENKTGLIETGINAGEVDMYNEDAIWAENSGDKIDIGNVLMEIIRAMAKTLPLSRKLRALSIGSGSEPQFKILEATFRGGLYLLDIDNVPLEVIRDRLKRQWIDHVFTIQSDYNRSLIPPQAAEKFLSDKLGGDELDLILLEHALYYTEESNWMDLFENLYRKLLRRKGAIHAVMMASKCSNEFSTTWLYNHYAGKYFGARNDQNLKKFAETLRKNKLFTNTRILSRTHRVKFFIDDFGKFMAVIWMILLYPNVHKYSRRQREEITEEIFKKFWKKKQPLIQMQDHLIIYRGIASE